jgi:hypothetical protein
MENAEDPVCRHSHGDLFLLAVMGLVRAQKEMKI